MYIRNFDPTQRNSSVGAAEIVDRLGGQWLGSYGIACCPAHKDSTPSLSVSDGEGGRLLLRCHAGCSFKDVMTALEKGGIHHQPDPTPRPAPARRDHSEAVERIWAASKPSPLLTRYLSARGIAMAPPTCLRVHSHLFHKPTATNWPAMVASVENDGGRVGLHRTFLQSNGRAKASIEPAKMALGDLKDGAVRLATPADVLGLGEGIETGLAAMLIHGIPTWAALSAPRLDRIAIPDSVRRIVIFGDNDKPGREAAQRAVRAYRKEGREVEVLFPDAGAKDFNDVLAARSGQGTP